MPTITEAPASSPVTLRLRKGSPETIALVEAWNQGIDAHLEAIVDSSCKDCGGVIQLEIATRDIPVLLRRLTELTEVEMADKGGPFEPKFPGAIILIRAIEQRSAMPPMSDFLRAYITTALWNETDDKGDQLEENYGPEHLAPKTLQKMTEDCNRFLKENGKLIEDAHADFDNPLTRAAQDFWLTRNGAGSGFWDGDWPEPFGDKLSEATKAFGTADLYVGDDGMLYL